MLPSLSGVDGGEVSGEVTGGGGGGRTTGLRVRGGAAFAGVSVSDLAGAV